MIPKYCIGAIMDLLDLIFGSLEALPIPNSVSEYIGTGISYIASGMRFVACYVDVAYLLSLLVVVAAVDAGMYLYKMTMWVVKKIPFWSVQ